MIEAQEDVPQETESSDPMASMARQIGELASDDQEDIDISEDSDIDVPVSSFWDNAATVKKEEVEFESPQDAPEEIQTITFKANGKDYNFSQEEAGKRLGISAELVRTLPTEAVQTALSKLEGGSQAFSKLAQANKRVKELESSQSELHRKAGLLDKLESVKDDWRAIINIATGQDPDQFLAEAMRKQHILETGSERDIKQLERDERLAILEKRLAAQEEEKIQAQERDQLNHRKSEASNLKSMLEVEFFKHKFELDNEIDSNDANELLWQQSQQRLKQYIKKYKEHPKFEELLPKMAQKSFEDVSSKLKRLTTGSVQSRVDDLIKAKKTKAAEQAAVSSTRRISENNSDDFRGLGIREIADKLIGKKKFSL